MNHILVIFLMFGGIFFTYLGFGGPLLGGGKIETQKFGFFAIVTGVLFSLAGIFFALGSIGMSEKTRLDDVEKTHLKAEEGSEVAQQARLKVEMENKQAETERARLHMETEKKLAEAEQARLQMETEKKLAEAERARLKAEIEVERTRLKAETQAELAQLKKEIEIERSRRLKTETEREIQQEKSQRVQKEVEAEQTRRSKTETAHDVKRVAEPQGDQEEKLPASFDCAQASSKAEKIICSDEDLSDADGRLGELYSRLEQDIENKGDLKEEQRAWLAHRDQELEICNKDISCALQVYEERIAQLTSQKSLSPISTKQWWGIVTTSKTDPLNIRSEMNTHSKVIDTVAQGEKILVLADYGTWYQVQSSEKTIGFAASQFIQPETKPQWGMVVTEASDLNVRTEMKVNAPVIGKVKKNTKVLILKTHAEWYQIQVEEGLTGYVAKQFIHLEK